MRWACRCPRPPAATSAETTPSPRVCSVAAAMAVTEAATPSLPMLASMSRHGTGRHPPIPTARPPAGDSTFHILFSGNNQPIWIGIHAQLGPIYLDQIGIILNGNTSASLVLDATVKVGPLTGQVDELGVTIPFKSLMTPGDWTLDLKGLALSFQTPGITIAGALLKNDSGPAIEYDGMLLIQITEFGLVAVGAYSKPKDAQGDYTSVFVFAGLFIIIGIPPVIEIDAIGLGVGYNRELIVPDDINQIPSFILVAALDDGGALANDPMGELMQIRDSIPAKRGSLWFAVGLHGTTFVIVHVTAIVYVALDRGVEIGAPRRGPHGHSLRRHSSGQRGAGPQSAVLLGRGYSLHPGPAHLQLLHLRQGLPAHRRLCLLHVVP